jgi:hypothetical protein
MRHYSDSVLFNWLRKHLGVQKPYALPMGEWDEWQIKIKNEKPVAYWITEILPDWLEKPAEWTIDPIRDLKYYLRNRFITKTHYLKTGLKPGQWHEFDERLLHGMFTELVDFVEIEKAHLHVIWGDKEDAARYQMPWWQRIYWFRWQEWRSPQAGVDYLKWEISLTHGSEWFSDPNHPDIGKPTPQAIAAKEILDLYEWWTVRRPARPDAYDASGWSAVCDEIRDKYGKLFAEITDPELKQRSDHALKLTTEIETQYEQEDTGMMIRLIKVRQSMWT